MLALVNILAISDKSLQILPADWLNRIWLFSYQTKQIRGDYSGLAEISMRGGDGLMINNTASIRHYCCKDGAVVQERQK